MYILLRPRELSWPEVSRSSGGHKTLSGANNLAKILPGSHIYPRSARTHRGRLSLDFRSYNIDYRSRGLFPYKLGRASRLPPAVHCTLLSGCLRARVLFDTARTPPGMAAAVRHSATAGPQLDPAERPHDEARNVVTLRFRLR